MKEAFSTNIPIDLPISLTPSTFQVLRMQFKLTAAFVLVGAALAVVNAAPTADAPVANIHPNPNASPQANPLRRDEEVRANRALG
ncbi:hypothetical protein BS17DRAFT_822631 [Gyrodon lividus]|nr:hypothetical protein BS17DRAFT_822631 [Gyrodon lividus]